jgi:Putative adhesin
MTGMQPIATQENRPAGDDPRPAGRGRLRMTPGRRTALVFGVPVCLAMVAATGLSLAATVGTANFPVHYAFPATAKRIAVSTDGGQLTLAQAATHQATLTGTAEYSLIRPNLSGTGASYNYHCRSPFGTCGLTATVAIPAGMTATMSTGGGNAEVTGTTGNVTVNTGGGELTARNISGTVTLTTGGGNITVGNASGPLTLGTDGGEVQANAIRSRDVTASSGGGNITIYFTAVPGDVSVSTAGGDITIVVPNDSAQFYHVIANTAGGSVSDTVPHNKTSPNVITATSGGGNITIREAAP